MGLCRNKRWVSELGNNSNLFIQRLALVDLLAAPSKTSPTNLFCTISIRLSCGGNLDEPAIPSPLRERPTPSRLRPLEVAPLRSDRALDVGARDLDEDFALVIKSLAPRDLVLLVKSPPRDFPLLVKPLAPDVFLRLLEPLLRTDDMLLWFRLLARYLSVGLMLCRFQICKSESKQICQKGWLLFLGCKQMGLTSTPRPVGIVAVAWKQVALAIWILPQRPRSDDLRSSAMIYKVRDRHA